MDISDLNCILTVAEEGSISKAADSLFISQPHLSRIIQNVEKDIGIIIFKRTNKGVEITKEGQIFLNYSGNIIRSYKDILNIRNINIERSKSFKLSTISSSLATESFIKLVDRYSNISGIEFSVRESYDMVPIDDVYFMKSDLGVIYININERDYIKNELKKKKISYKSVCPLESCIGLRVGHPLLKKDKIYIEDLYKYGLVRYSKDYLPYSATFSAGDYYNEIIDVNRVYDIVEVSDRASLNNVVNQTDYFTIGVQSSKKQEELFNTVCVPIEDIRGMHFFEMGVVSHENIELTDLSKEFINILMEDYGNKNI